MEFDFDKLITYKNAEEAVIGEKYYFFNTINDNTVHGEMNKPIGTLVDVRYSGCNSFKASTNEAGEVAYYAFIYPYEEQEKRCLTYEELRARWLRNPTELYRYQTEDEDVISVITGADDRKKLISLNNVVFSEDERYEGDNFVIKNIKDINGNPLIKEE